MSIPLVLARGFTALPPGRVVDLVVIHTIEAPEGAQTAEGCARYFQTTSRQVSSHYCVDADSVVQCVREKDVAWCAPGANHDGVHIEHAGYARQTAQEWRDDYSRRMLERSAALAADVAERHRIPVRWLSPSDLIAGRRGFTSHDHVSKAFKRSTHWDPGTGFPVDRYLASVAAHLSEHDADDSLPTVTREEWTWRRWWLGEGEFRDHGPHVGAVRPTWVRARVPATWWARLEAFQAARG